MALTHRVRRLALLSALGGLGIVGGGAPAAAQEAPGAAPQATAAGQPQSPPADTPRLAMTELIIEDRAGRPLTNVRLNEVIVMQAGVSQVTGSLTYDGKAKLYELRYIPRDGQLGPVSIRVARPGSRVRSPYGDAVSVQWVEPPKPFETPLVAALESATLPTDVDFELRPLHFGEEEGGRHFAFAVEVPTGTFGATAVRRLAFMTRVLRENGRLACHECTEQEVTAGNRQYVVWASHCHLRPGTYSVESVVADESSSRLGAKRQALRVEEAGRLRTSSLVVVAGTGTLLAGERTDNPLRVADQVLVPALRPEYVMGSPATVNCHIVLFPQPGSTEPVTGEVLLVQGGAVAGHGKIEMPPPEPTGEIQYFGSLPLGGWPVGAYEVRIVARQGDTTVEEGAPFSIVEPPRVQAPPTASIPGAVRVGGRITEPRKTKDAKPVYPPHARQARQQGVVALEATIGPDGKVVNVRPIRGPSRELIDAAVEAVRQWEYTPTLVDGKPVPVIMTVTMNFRIS